MSTSGGAEHERRGFQRSEVKFLVLYKVNEPLKVRMQIGERLINAIAVNLSAGGMAVLSNFAVPPDTIVSLQFTLVNEAEARDEDCCRTINIRGQIRHSNLTHEKTYRLGICFLDMSAGERNFIIKFVALAPLHA
jgi:c-di-GMP-binding flagellar brake protein YcgR